MVELRKNKAGRYIRSNGTFASKSEIKEFTKKVVKPEKIAKKKIKHRVHYHVFKCHVSAFDIHHTMLIEGVSNPNRAKDIHDDTYGNHTVKDQFYLGSKEFPYSDSWVG